MTTAPSSQAAFDPSFPALLRAARLTYGQTMRAALADAGFDDIPGNGLFVIGAAARAALSMALLVRDLGITKQAAGQLVDILTMRGYVQRVADPHDRRRLLIAASERGHAAAAAMGAAVDRIDAELARALPAKAIADARKVLLTLAQLRTEPKGETAR